MGALYDRIQKKQSVTTPTQPGVPSPLQPYTSPYTARTAPQFSVPQVETGKGLYERVRAKMTQREQVQERSGNAELIAPGAFAPSPALFGTKTSTPQFQRDDLTVQRLAQAMGRGIARGYAVHGARLSQTSFGASTDVVDPKSFFGDTELGRKAAEAVFGSTEPFNATTEDIAFLETVGVDPEVAKGTGGSLTIMLSTLDLFGGGGAVKGYMNVVKAIRAANTVEDAIRIARGVGLSDDVAKQYADAFVNAKTVKEAKTALEEATKAQSGAKTGPFKAAVPEDDLTEARKYKNADEFVKANRGRVVLRQGDIQKDGAYFTSGEGGSTYFDTQELGSLKKAYDIADAKIVSSDTPEAIKVLEEALKETIDPRSRKAIEESLSDGFIDYGMNDNIPEIVKTAKKMGYDGIKVWEADSVGNPDSLFIWNIDKVKEINLTDIWKKANEVVSKVPKRGIPKPEMETVVLYRGQNQPKFSLDSTREKVHGMKGTSFSRERGMAEAYSYSGLGNEPTIVEGTIPSSKILKLDDLPQEMRERIRKEVAAMEEDDIIEGSLIENVMDEVIPYAEKIGKEAVDVETFTRGLVPEVRVIDSSKSFKVRNISPGVPFTAKTLPKLPKVPKQAKVPTNAQLDELSRQVRELGGKTPDEIAEKLGEYETRLAIADESIESMPGKELMKYVSKKEGQFIDLKDPNTARTSAERARIEERNRKVLTTAEEVFQGTRWSDTFDDPDSIREAIEEYQAARAQIDAVREEMRTTRTSLATLRKASRTTRIGTQYRKAQYRAIAMRYNLTDTELAKFRRGRDISAMEESEFRTFMAEAEKYGEMMEKRSQAMVQLKATIHEKDLKKWENLVQAMNLPPVHQMNTEQLVNLEKILDQYKSGDEFLPVRMLETIDRTKLAGAKTVREILEVLAKEKGISPEDVAKIKPTEFHRYMGDVTLARQHPFFERLVTIKNEAFMKANARVIELTDEVDKLVENARASRARGLAERAVPTDENIVHWLEADTETRAVIEKGMTPEELKASKRMDDIFREYYDYLVKKHADGKFSRFENQYFPHVRRGFLEAWKEDGILKAFKELRDQFAQDHKYMEILNEQTGEVLPYEKWVGFTQYRTDKLVPTKNAARAFESYVTALEKARHLDEMVPEVMAYVHALSPRVMSERGLELDTGLKRFVKEYVNANKGRHPKGFFEPGGKLDWTLRSSVAFTRMKDLGFNFTTQLVAPIGENAMTLTMLKPQGYATAVARRATAQGGKIVEKYRVFVGRSLFDDLSRATGNLGDKLLEGMFAMYHVSARQANELFLLGKMTEEEFTTGVISTERLARLQLEMGKYRKVKGLESIIERTSEATAALQYKSWALPILRATVTNTIDLAKMIREKGIRTALASDAGKELFYSVGLGLTIGGLFYSEYKRLGDQKDRSFMEDLAYKAMRDSISILGTFDPMMWAEVRVMSYYEDLAEAIHDLVTLDTYKTTGELKAPKEFMRLITPAPVRQLQRELKDEEPTKSKGGKLPTPAGLPQLPKLELPELPKLPSL